MVFDCENIKANVTTVSVVIVIVNPVFIASITLSFKEPSFLFSILVVNLHLYQGILIVLSL